MVANVETSIWERIVEPSWEDLSPDAARALLQLKFTQPDVDRINELSALARDGALTDQQQAELEAYMRVGRMVSILQSKARLSLKRPHRGP